jgi:cytochrome c oxidase subunit IV
MVNEQGRSLIIYFVVFGTLLVLTGFTTWIAFVNLGEFNVVVALGIAFAKAVLVVLFFMHVFHSSKLTKIVVATALFWLLILIGFTLSDYLSRNWFDSGWNR